jgi:hypothetical protein
LGAVSTCGWWLLFCKEILAEDARNSQDGRGSDPGVKHGDLDRNPGPVSWLEIEDGGSASQRLFFDASTTVANQVAQQSYPSRVASLQIFSMQVSASASVRRFQASTMLDTSATEVHYYTMYDEADLSSSFLLSNGVNWPFSAAAQPRGGASGHVHTRRRMQLLQEAVRSLRAAQRVSAPRKSWHSEWKCPRA